MKQVTDGPPHSSTTLPLTIEGAELMVVPTVEYEYGALSEIFRRGWATILREPIEHVYVIENDAAARHHWHVHLTTTDRYVLLAGSVEIALYDAREDSSTRGRREVVTLTGVRGAGPSGLRIPPGVWHTFQSNDAPFMLLNSKFPPYSPENPDKYEVAIAESGVSAPWSADALESPHDAIQ